MTKELLHKYGLTIPPYKGSSIYQDITHCSLQPSNSSNQWLADESDHYRYTGQPMQSSL